jgi:hypothetical protein
MVDDGLANAKVHAFNDEPWGSRHAHGMEREIEVRLRELD